MANYQFSSIRKILFGSSCLYNFLAHVEYDKCFVNALFVFSYKCKYVIFHVVFISFINVTCVSLLKYCGISQDIKFYHSLKDNLNIPLINFDIKFP